MVDFILMVMRMGQSIPYDKVKEVVEENNNWAAVDGS